MFIKKALLYGFEYNPEYGFFLTVDGSMSFSGPVVHFYDRSHPECIYNVIADAKRWEEERRQRQQRHRESYSCI